MLYFIGLGLEQSPSLGALEKLRECDKIYYESYTSPVINDNVLEELSRALTDARFEVVKREFVEDGRTILDTAKDSIVAIVCSGDPMIATTHQELRTRAIRQGIQTKIVHGSSVIAAIGGELGLHSYNFGRIVTMTSEPMQYTAYSTIFRNLLQGLHSTVLFQWDESTSFFLEPSNAVKSLLEAEADLRNDVFGGDTLVLVVSRLGTDNTKLSSLSIDEMLTADLGKPPHAMVVPGKLHFTEKEALGALFNKNPESFRDNSENVIRISEKMVSKYSEKTMKALERAKLAAAKRGLKFADVFENVECYTRDSQRFINEGKEELAVLSIGYAEGLLDSLRFSGQLEFEW
ncbi:MAG: diphthine synthase [Nitrososphaerota archaeon]|nr:diphthine synthase [Nitrososphaerota archaeon]